MPSDPPNQPSPSVREQRMELAQARRTYRKHLLAGENTQALPYFARMAEAAYEQLLASPNFNKQTPSIITSFAPKSGGTFLHNRLLDAGCQPYFWGFPNHDCHTSVNIEPAALRRYLQGGCACHTHVRPVAKFWQPLEAAGVERVWVHLRNPAECTVSSYYHFLGEGHGSGRVGAKRRRAAKRQLKQLKFNIDDKDNFIGDYINWHCDWAAQWLAYAGANPGKVVFSFYDELSDTPGLLNRIFAEFGGEASQQISGEVQGKDRFRKKASKDWRAELHESTVAHMEKVVAEKLGHFDAYERLCWRPASSESAKPQRRRWFHFWPRRNAA